jgi:hypothetical protein
MSRKVVVTTVEPLAWRIPEGAKRAGHGETKFREAVDTGELTYVPVGADKIVEDEEIRRWLRSKRRRAGVAEAEVRLAVQTGELAGTLDGDNVTIENIEQFQRWLGDRRARAA